MKKVLIIMAALFCFASIVSVKQRLRAASDQFTPPIGGIIFSSMPILRSGLAGGIIRTAFSSSDKIYARIFLSQPVGDIRNGETGFVDLWIDGRFIKRMTFTNRDLIRTQSEFQLFLLNTGQDDFTGAPLKSLDQGEHEIRLDVGIIYNREQPIARYGVGGSPVSWVVNLATGKFILAVR